jgi:hypothetical protein
MLRSVGIAAVVVGLAWTGLAGAQSSSPLEKAHFINVSEEGKPPQRCKLLKTWRDAKGAPVFQVQAVDTGEMMTIVGTSPHGAGSDPREMTTRIFRWGRSTKPPAGVPVPPPSIAAPATSSQPASVRKPPAVAPQPIRSAPVVSSPQPTSATLTWQKPKPASTSTPAQPTITPNTVTNNKPASSTVAAKPTSVVKGETQSMKPISTHTAQYSSASSLPAASTANRLTSKPAPTAVAVKSSPVVSSKPPQLTPLGTQVVQYSPASPKANQLPEVPKAGDSQPRLAPLPAGSIGNPKSCNGACPQPCEPCCKPCNPCGQSSCVCGTPSPMRQPLIGRLFKSNTPCPCTTVACQPPPSVPTQSVATSAMRPAAATPPPVTVVKTTAEPAKSSDWRKSWGKVEPWKESAKANSVKPIEVAKHVDSKPIEVTKRVDPKPVAMEASKQSNPLNNPDQYRDLVMTSRLANSKIPQQGQPSAVKRPLFAKRPPMGPMPPARPAEEVMTANGPSNGPANLPMSPGQMVAVSADEPNAFWSPKSPSGKEKEKINAFDRPAEPLPQGVPPAIAGVPPAIPGVPPSLPGVAIGLMPPRGPVMNMPTPPLPATAAQRGPVAMMPDSGVPGAMGNAFTLPATSRPIPADFGGTPQEPNGFDPLTRGGQGAPPRVYGMGMAGAYRQPMSNMVAMGPQAPMGVNPLMSVPPTPPNMQAVASSTTSASSGSVPQLLAALKDSLCPSEREAAAEQLSELNWRMQPLVVESLMKSAREDPAATVRAACVHALAHMKVDTPAACALVRDMRSDRDPHVRQEAEEALNALGDSGIQQASHK